MIHKMATDDLGYIRVCFELPSCLWADRIYVVGDFNQWDEAATPMQQERDGVWRATVELRRGSSYEFRYLIDGQWTSDSHADGFAQNRFGVSNSVVHASLPMPTLSHTEHPITGVIAMRVQGTHRISPARGMTYPTTRRRATA